MTQTKAVSYRSTAIACYIGNFVQSIVINLTPILFIPLREQFGFSYEQLGLLILINFVTQVLSDIGFSGVVDRFGYRPFVVASHALTIIGFGLFALAPLLFSNAYIGFVIATVIFSASGGLLEVLLSPIVNSIPTDEKAMAMSVLHSFYAWGQVTTVLLTTLFLFFFGKAAWQIIVALWMIVPLFNFFFFMKVPMAPPIPEEHRQGMRALITKPFFIVAFFAIIFGGAAENALAQWTSAYMEKAIALPKIVGDTAGMCMFGFMLGLGRLLNGTFGNRFNLSRLMQWGSLFAVVCYLVVALSPVPMLSLVFCALCGFMVSLLWPGTLSLSAERYPYAGAWMFAILAAGGDIGCSAGPAIMSVVAERAPGLPMFAGFLQGSMTPEQFGLRLSMLVGALFPIGAFVCLTWLIAHMKKGEKA